MNHTIVRETQNRTRRYLARRLPWGTPWWAYALALGPANVARQLAVPDDVAPWLDIGSFIVMVALVGGLVTLIDIVRRALVRSAGGGADASRPDAELTEDCDLSFC
jgi:hypothetical protein